MKLNIKGLCFSYGSKAVLNDVSFSAMTGECTAILGKNGVGKSTLLKCIDKIFRCSAGEITIDGINTDKIRQKEFAKIVGYVPQELMFANLTVFEAILVGRIPFLRNGVTKNDLNIVDELIERLGLESLADRNVFELSGGEKQKVASARALAQKPKVLLVDEPTSNLDIHNQLETLDIIKRASRDDDIAVIVTMHDVNLALRFADKFVIMKDNTIYACGNESVVTEDVIREVYNINAKLINTEGKKYYDLYQE